MSAWRWAAKVTAGGLIGNTAATLAGVALSITHAAGDQRIEVRELTQLARAFDDHDGPHLDVLPTTAALAEEGDQRGGDGPHAGACQIREVTRKPTGSGGGWASRD